jgi:hypothetical protein
MYVTIGAILEWSLGINKTKLALYELHALKTFV